MKKQWYQKRKYKNFGHTGCFGGFTYGEKCARNFSVESVAGRMRRIRGEKSIRQEREKSVVLI